MSITLPAVTVSGSATISAAAAVELISGTSIVNVSGGTGHAFASIFNPFLLCSIDLRGGDENSCRVSCPGLTSTAPLEYLYRWTDAEGQFSWQADIEALCSAIYYDVTKGYGPGDGVGTPRGRPNHLRQIHFGYALVFASDITASASGAFRYVGALTLDEANALYGEEHGWEHVGDEINREATVTIAETTYSTIVPGTAYRYTLFSPWSPDSPEDTLPNLSLGGRYLPPPAFPPPAGTIYGQMGGGISHAPDLSIHNNGNPLYTSAGGLSVTCRTRNGAPDAYRAWPGVAGGINPDAEDLNGHAVTLKGWNTPPTREAPVASYPLTDTRLGSIENSTGPTWSPSLETPVWSWAFAAVLDPDRGRDQAHWYGNYERLWAQPPEVCTWSPFTVSHVASITVDDFTSAHPDQTVNNLSGGDGTYYAWTGTNLGTGGAIGVSGTYRTAIVGADAVAPTLSRRLQSDWDDCEADPSAYRDDASTPAAVAAYIGKGHAGGIVGGTGNWYCVRKAVRAGTDVYNWGNHRWLRVSGKGGGEWTLKIYADSIAIIDNFHLGELGTNPEADPADTSNRVITVARTPVTVECGPFQFAAGDTDIYIDLAEAAARAACSLAHVTRVEFLLEAPGSGTDTYQFDSITLCSGAASGLNDVNEASPSFRVFAGVPYADDAAIAPVADGRVCCLQDTGTGLSPFVLTAIQRQASVAVGFEDKTGRGADETKLLEELAVEVGFQEGITVSAVAALPAAFADWAGWALYLDAGETTGAISATIKGNSLLLPALLERTIAAESTFGAALYGIATDESTAWPASGYSVAVEGARGGGVYDSLAGDTTNASGAFSACVPQAARGLWQDGLDDDDPAREPLYSLHRVTAPGLAGSTSSGTCPNRHAAYHYLTGEVPATETAGAVSLAVSETGAFVRAYEVGANVRVQRRTWDGGTWQTIGERAGSEPAVCWGLDGRPYCLINVAGSVTEWNVEDNTVAVLATGSYPKVRWNGPHSLKAVTYWRASRHRCRVYDGQGNDLYGEVTVQAADVPEGVMAVDWRADGTLEGVYHDGTDAVQVTSETGEVWA